MIPDLDKVYELTWQGISMRVTVEKCTECAAFVKAEEGFPFNLIHGYGEFTFEAGEFWYSHHWVSQADLIPIGD